jgi:hypothetical protein
LGNVARRYTNFIHPAVVFPLPNPPENIEFFNVTLKNFSCSGVKNFIGTEIVESTGYFGNTLKRAGEA